MSDSVGTGAAPGSMGGLGWTSASSQAATNAARRRTNVDARQPAVIAAPSFEPNPRAGSEALQVESTSGIVTDAFHGDGRMREAEALPEGGGIAAGAEDPGDPRVVADQALDDSPADAPAPVVWVHHEHGKVPVGNAIAQRATETEDAAGIVDGDDVAIGALKNLAESFRIG